MGLLKRNFTNKISRLPSINRVTSYEYKAQIRDHQNCCENFTLAPLACDPSTYNTNQTPITCKYISLRQQFQSEPLDSDQKKLQEMSSTFRDRTVEFRSLSETLKKIGGITAVHHQAENDPASSKPLVPAATTVASSRSEFNKKASRIGLGIHETSNKIARLAQCKPIYTNR